MIDALVSAGNAGADDDENGSKLDATNHDGTTSDKEETLHRTSVALVPDAATVDTCKDEDEDEDEDDYICEEDEDQTRFSEAVKPDECDILMPMCSANSENYIENILCKADEALCVCSVTDNFENLVGIQVCDVDDDVKDDNDDDNATVIDSSFEDNDEEKMAENQAWEEISISAALIDSFTAHKKFSITCTSSNIISTLPTCTHGREVIHAEGQSVLVSTVTAFRDMVRNPFPANMQRPSQPPNQCLQRQKQASGKTSPMLQKILTTSTPHQPPNTTKRKLLGEWLVHAPLSIWNMSQLRSPAPERK